MLIFILLKVKWVISYYIKLCYIEIAIMHGCNDIILRYVILSTTAV